MPFDACDAYKPAPGALLITQQGYIMGIPMFRAFGKFDFLRPLAGSPFLQVTGYTGDLFF